MNLFRLEPGLAVWTWIAFLGLFAVLSRYVFPKMLAGLKERETMIAQSVEDAEAAAQYLAESTETRKRMVKEGRAEGDGLIRQARDEAEKVRAEVLSKAQTEAEDIIRQARRRVAEERETAVTALTEELAVFVCDTAEKVVDRSFTDEDDRAWTHELVDKL